MSSAAATAPDAFARAMTQLGAVLGRSIREVMDAEENKAMKNKAMENKAMENKAEENEAKTHKLRQLMAFVTSASAVTDGGVTCAAAVDIATQLAPANLVPSCTLLTRKKEGDTVNVLYKAETTYAGPYDEMEVRVNDQPVYVSRLVDAAIFCLGPWTASAVDAVTGDAAAFLEAQVPLWVVGTKVQLLQAVHGLSAAPRDHLFYGFHATEYLCATGVRDAVLEGGHWRSASTKVLLASTCAPHEFKAVHKRDVPTLCLSGTMADTHPSNLRAHRTYSPTNLLSRGWPVWSNGHNHRLARAETGQWLVMRYTNLDNDICIGFIISVTKQKGQQHVWTHDMQEWVGGTWVDNASLSWTRLRL
jgi:hypothetical protein